jgi:hypothetical protein
VLLLADLLVGAAAVAGLLRPWAPVVPVLLTVLFLVVARVTVRREHARRQRETQRRRTTQPAAAPVAEQAPASEVAPLVGSPLFEHAPRVVEVPVPDQRNEQGLNVVSGLDDTSSIPVVRIEDDGRSGSLWDPLPVTLPTYVTKPRASRSVRTIDLTAPDVSSSGRSSAASALVAEAATAASASRGEDESARAVGS